MAHSQGNLFANSAYQYALQKVSEDAVKVVHVAPASPLVYGDYALADLDLVISALRKVGSVPPVTDYIPGYLGRPAGENGKKDALGHGFLEIYLNQQLRISDRTKNSINIALDTLRAPPKQAIEGLFTVTLTWNGAGDVDLHILEPDESHVFYNSMVGASGYLDVDNTEAYGPEHYYASCDSSTLQIGHYQVSVANYERAEGREATLQVASWRDGVLGTKVLVLGESTKDVPANTVFSVLVEKDDIAGSYSVSIER